MSEQQPDRAPARQDGPPATPTWVKTIGVTVALLVLLVVVAGLTGGIGGHGPGLHGG